MEDSQKQFLDDLRENFEGRGFEFLERPYLTLANRVEEKLRSTVTHTDGPDAASGIYLVCHNADRALAKTIRSFLHSQGPHVEWTPIDLSSEELGSSADHEKLLHRNQAHLVLHGETSESWIQDRIRGAERYSDVWSAEAHTIDLPRESAARGQG